METLRKPLWFLLQSVTLGLALAFVVVWLRPGWFNGASGTDTVSYAAAVEAAAPAVVNIHSNRRVARSGPGLLADPTADRFYGDRSPTERIETSLGSGVLISDRGYILTNHHVISGADEIQVALLDGRVVAATIVGTDPETDLALLHIDLQPLPDLPPSTAPLRVGDVVLAIGNPFGIGQTVTQGIVSATGRNYLGLTTFENFIQTDAAINPGNSGGALVNARGELVGINTAFYSQTGGIAQGIGFAIPADLARGVMDQLVRHGRVIRGWLGVVPQDLTPELVDVLQVPQGSGILVSAVQMDSPAAHAGLRAGDIIVALDGEEVADGRDALNRIAARAPGTRVRMRVWRNDGMVELEAEIGERNSR